MDGARMTLNVLIRHHGETYMSISKFLGRNPAYIQQFIKRGTPKKLDEGDRRILAKYFGIAETMLADNSSPTISIQDTIVTPFTSQFGAHIDMKQIISYSTELGIAPEVLFRQMTKQVLNI